MQRPPAAMECGLGDEPSALMMVIRDEVAIGWGQTLITVSASTVLHLCVSARRSAISDASKLKKNNRLTLTV